MGQIEDLRDYDENGVPKKRYHLHHNDKWWDIGFLFHAICLIGIWVVYDMATTGYMTEAQFKLDHTITFFWVVIAGVYSAVAVVHDIMDAAAASRDARSGS